MEFVSYYQASWVAWEQQKLYGRVPIKRESQPGTVETNFISKHSARIPRGFLWLRAPLAFLKCDPDFRRCLCWLMSGRSICVTTPTHRSSGTEAPLSRTTVGKRSMLLVGSSILLPPGMVPDQRRSPGTRIPPSQLVDLPAAQRSASKVRR